MRVKIKHKDGKMEYVETLEGAFMREGFLIVRLKEGGEKGFNLDIIESWEMQLEGLDY